jgi:hypothetical protein
VARAAPHRCGVGRAVGLAGPGRPGLRRRHHAGRPAGRGGRRRGHRPGWLAECGKYLAEIDKEIAKAKLTLAELDEEEQSLERLRRWHRELRLRDVLGAPSAAGADQRLKECEAKLEDYTQRVFHAVGGQ